MKRLFLIALVLLSPPAAFAEEVVSCIAATGDAFTNFHPVVVKKGDPA